MMRIRALTIDIQRALDYFLRQIDNAGAPRANAPKVAGPEMGVLRAADGDISSSER